MLEYLPIDLPGESYTKLNQHLNTREYTKLCREVARSRYSVVRASEALALHDKGRLPMENQVRVIWIHDVERPSENWLAEEMAKIEAGFGLRSTYNIRIFCAMTDELRRPLRAVVKHGGEIEYQYEDLVAAGGDVKKARRLFAKNLAYLRGYFKPMTVAFAHGVWKSGIDSTRQFFERGRWAPKTWIRHGIHPKGELYYFMDLLKEELGGRFHYVGEAKCLGADEFVAALRKTKPGDVAVFLQHPTWWTDLIDVARIKHAFRESVFFKR